MCEYTRFRWGVIAASVAIACAAQAAAPQGIVIDGRFEDWEGIPVAFHDPEDDGSSLDFGELRIASDAERVYVYFEVGSPINIQNDNRVVLSVYDATVPMIARPHWREEESWRWVFGEREGQIWTLLGPEDFRQADVGLRQAPTVTSRRFEVAFDRDAKLHGRYLFPTGLLRMTLREDVRGGDVVPNPRGQVGVALSDEAPPDPLAADLGRQEPRHVRLLSYNVLRDKLFAHTAPFARIVRAIDPDVICFQEIYDHTAAETKALVDTLLPGADWSAVGDADCMIVSRYPIADSETLPPNGQNVWALIDLPDDDYAADLSVVSAHPPCCADNVERQNELDAIAAWMRDLENPPGGGWKFPWHWFRLGPRRNLVYPGSARLPRGTGVVVAGDMNLVTYEHQVRTLTDGAIRITSEHGPPHLPDWDQTPLEDAFPCHTTGREAYTWRDDSDTYAPGKLDYIVYSDSVLGLGNHFALWTPDLTSAELGPLGLEGSDTRTASDHLPLVADFYFPGDAP